ncbi:glycosyltransferase family 4 protein [Inmirania thermothiophila]|uniref:Phosphatidylinositol alpha-1,6-mannosyltransferase n=1 Tax=Inmirania thermothiophila TaxID=1750597 RepID=A0A3N1XSL1_9GAMM|nr:glycosyltransferase family 4 protein [Inmirania thermothiophila]ROR29634.1 phosphatidylinositol alpha-1,6-mannosyltransferase [Inmirania thermothiophila]
MPAERRYLVLTELFLPTKGGTAVWFDEVYRRLGDRGTHIVTAAVPGAAEHDRDHPNTVHRIRWRPSRWLRPYSLPIYARLAATAHALMARHRLDAVHAGRVLPEGLVGWSVAALWRRPLVVYAHGEEITTWGRIPRRRRAMRFVYRRATHVIANSDFTRERLLELGVPAARIRVIHPGVDTARFRRGPADARLRARLGLAEGTRLILSVGRLSRRKGFDRVIEALPALLARGLDVHYAVIGIGEDEAHLRALAEGCGVARRVHLLGHVPPDELPAWYRTADVFAMPNRPVGADAEGFGMVYIEAAACGTPAVAGRHGGTGAAVLDGETGLRVDGESVEAVAEGLARLLAEPELARRLAENAWRRAVEELSWERVAERTRALEEAA